MHNGNGNGNGKHNIEAGQEWVSHGPGIRNGRRVLVVRVIPMPEGPNRLELRDLDNGRITKPLTTSLLVNYKLVDRAIKDATLGIPGYASISHQLMDLARQLNEMAAEA